MLATSGLTSDVGDGDIPTLMRLTPPLFAASV
jgi:hypothetical protein